MFSLGKCVQCSTIPSVKLNNAPQTQKQRELKKQERKKLPLRRRNKSTLEDSFFIMNRQIPK